MTESRPVPCFPREALEFFRALERHNDREWFQARKGVYEEKVRAPMVAMVEALNRELAGLSPDYVTEPGQAIYRIYRDTRFSKDKRPYKTNIGASFWHRRLYKHRSAGFYFGVSPAEVEIAGGIYMPETEQILAVRQLLAARHGEFREMTQAKGFRSLLGVLQGEKLARMPKGFPAEHPAGAVLRHKAWYWYVTLEAEIAATPRLMEEVWKRFRALKPVVDFLNEPLLAAQRRAAERAQYAGGW